MLSTRPSWDNLGQVQEAFDEWEPVYNYQRPHESLGETIVPADRYAPSPRSLPDTIPDPVYPSNWLIRKVDSSARVSLNGHRIPVGKPFRGRSIAIAPTPRPRRPRPLPPTPPDRKHQPVHHVPERASTISPVLTPRSGGGGPERSEVGGGPVLTAETIDMILHADDPPGAIAVSLLYGYTLDEKEARIARLIGGYAPGVAVTLSGRVAPRVPRVRGHLDVGSQCLPHAAPPPESVKAFGLSVPSMVAGMLASRSPRHGA